MDFKQILDVSMDKGLERTGRQCYNPIVIENDTYGL
jgi:hypothetical protein